MSETTEAPASASESISIGTLWDTLQTEFTNMGRALTCPLCLSTYRDAVVLPCVHAYCSSCLKEALQQGPPRCPTCLTKATKRSMQPAPELNKLTQAYKLALRHFGLAPVQFDPSYNAMTQIAPDELQEASGGMTIEPYRSRDRQDQEADEKRRSTSLLDCHMHLQVSRTWQKVLQERQQQQEEQEEEEEQHEQELRHMKQRQQQQQQEEGSKSETTNETTTTTASSKVPGNIPTKSRLHVWQQQQQAQVIASHERALIDAARLRQQGPPPPEPSPAIDLSMQQEISMENELEQEVINRDAEEWLLEQEQQHKAVSEQHHQEETTASTTTQDSQFFLTPREADSNPQNYQSQQQDNDDNDVVMKEESSGILVADADNDSDAVAEDDEPPRVFMTAESQHAKDYVVEQQQSADDDHNGRKYDEDVIVQDYDDYTEPPPPQRERNRTIVHMNQERHLNDHEEANHSRSDAARDRTPLQSNVVAGARAAARLNLQDTANVVGEFSVGDIVHVQSRTWPGVNKPGGIARITKVLDKEGSSYHVEYILGGREKHVDAIFVSKPPEEMVMDDDTKAENDDDDDQKPESSSISAAGTSNNEAKKRGRKSRRISIKRREQAQQDDILPPDLLQQLAKEGFDVPTAAAANNRGAFRPAASTDNSLVVRVKSEGNFQSRSKSEMRTKRTAKKAPVRRAKSEGATGTTTTTTTTTTSRGRRGRSAAVVKEKQEPEDSSSRPAVILDDKNNGMLGDKENAGPNFNNRNKENGRKKEKVRTAKQRSNSVATTKGATHNKKQKTLPNSSPSGGSLPALPESNNEICKLANQNYQERIQAAIETGFLTIVASGLSDAEKSALKSLAKEAKNNGNGML
jgi:hypothetical protein